MKTNWQTKKLGEVCDIFNGNSINAKVKKEKYFGLTKGHSFIATKDIRFDSNIDYENGVKIPNNETRFKISNKDSVLICAEGGSAGRKIGFTEKDVCFGNKLFSINSDKQNNKFIYYFCFTNYFQKEFKKSLTGIIGGVSLKKFKNIEILLPPLPEQHRIVKILDEVFEKTGKAKENAERNLKNAKDLFESYLENVFANPGKDWEEKKLGEILEIERGGSPRPIQKYLTSDTNGINWIKIGDTKNVDKYIYKTRQKIISEGLKKSRLVKEGDFILSNSMSFGRPYIMKTTGAIHDGWLVLREKKHNVINKNYLYNILNSPYVFNQFDKLAAGSTVRNLNISLVSSVKIPLPSIPEQKSIVKKLDALSAETKKLESIYKQKLLDLEELKKSVLKSAFAGKY